MPKLDLTFYEAICILLLFHLTHFFFYYRIIKVFDYGV